MNSFIQVLYMTYGFRNAILSIPLCGDEIKKDEKWSNQEKFLFEWQKLFIEMKSIEKQAVSTVSLTGKFGWEGNEAAV